MLRGRDAASSEIVYCVTLLFISLSLSHLCTTMGGEEGGAGGRGGGSGLSAREFPEKEALLRTRRDFESHDKFRLKNM